MTSRAATPEENARLFLLVDELDELCTAQIAGLGEGARALAQYEMGHALLVTAVRMLRRSTALRDPIVLERLRELVTRGLDVASEPSPEMFS